MEVTKPSSPHKILKNQRINPKDDSNKTIDQIEFLR